MGETVKDRSGRAFQVERRGGRARMVPFGGRSFRAVLTQANDTNSILDNPDNRPTLVRALVDVGYLKPDEADDATMEDLRPLVTSALSSGALSFVTRRGRFRPLCDINAAAPAESLADEVVEEVRATHTLEIELVDEDDEPVPNEPFRVELPNGEIVNGNLNALGKAMLTGIADSGNCKVTFPRLDEATWGPG